MPSNGQEWVFFTVEDWRKFGPPAETWSSAGAGWLMMQKGTRSDLKGTGIGLMPMYSELGARGGANYDYAFRYSSNPTGVQFKPPVGAHWEVMEINHKQMELLSEPGSLVGPDTVVPKTMALTATRCMKSISPLIWSDGTGLISKGDGLYDVSTITIQLKNAHDAYKWELKDRIVFVEPATKDAADAGVQPARRAFADPSADNLNGYLEIVAINRDTGKLTVNVPVTDAIPTAAPGDWIGPAAEWDAPDDEPYQGLFTYAPRRRSRAEQDLFGVQRSKDPTRLAGSRVLVAVNDTPYAIIGALTSKAFLAIGAVQDGDGWCCFVPGAELVRLNAELAARQVVVTKSSVQVGSYTQTLSMGVASTTFVMPGWGPIKVIADTYLTDSELAKNEDRTYVLFRPGNPYFATTSKGLNWRDYDGQGGPLHQISGSQRVYAQFGSWANVYVQDTSRIFVASTHQD